MLTMRLAEILERIEQRLAALGLSADTASKLAGKPDAIRNIRRAMKGGTRQGVQTATLDALAPVLQTTAEWLLAGTDDEPASPTPSAAPRYGQGAGMLPMQ